MSSGIVEKALLQLKNSRSRGWLLLVLLMLLLSVTLVPSSPVVLADGGDFSIDLAAAAPLTYNHSTGGGAFDNKDIGINNDVVESLQGGDYACGDIVTFLTQITVDAGAIGSQDIELDYEFLADTTGQSGVGYVDILTVQVNYGNVGGEGAGGTDSGIVDDGGSTATLVSENLVGTVFTPGAKLQGSVQVTDLEAGEKVVVRVDVRISCKPGSNPTGNLQASVVDADVISPTPDNISVGNQTVPLQNPGAVVEINFTIVKTANPTEIYEPGAVVTYTVTITNPSTQFPLTIEAMSDNKFNDITTTGHDGIQSTNCTIPWSIPINSTASCTFTVLLQEQADDGVTDNPDDPHINIVTATGGGFTKSDDATVDILNDAAKPVCRVVGYDAGTDTVLVEAGDLQSGLASVQVTKAINVNYVIPPFTPGDRVILNITATRINPSLGGSFAIKVTDMSGNFATCDPLITLVARDNGQPVSETYELAPTDRSARVINHTPGLKNLEIEVNGTKFKVTSLGDGQETTLDISSAINQEGSNTVVLTAFGKPGTSATVMTLGRQLKFN